MMELSIDTSTRYASVSLSQKGEMVAALTWTSRQNHSVELTPSVNSLMDRIGIGIPELEAVYIASGPGGFSALRVGMSLAKSIAYSRNIPLVCIPTLDIEAEPYLGLSRPVTAIIPAGKRRKYVGKYQIGGSPEYLTVENENISKEIQNSPVICGEGADELQGSLNSGPNRNISFTICPPPTRQPSVIAKLGYDRLFSGNVDDIYSAEPIYLRSTQLENAQRSVKL